MANKLLIIMAYKGRLRPKGIPFSDFRYMKGWGFHSLKYTAISIKVASEENDA